MTHRVNGASNMALSLVRDFGAIVWMSFGRTRMSGQQLRQLRQETTGLSNPAVYWSGC
jgi:hypothetical protein